jgi:hypothetical protein
MYNKNKEDDFKQGDIIKIDMGSASIDTTEVGFPRSAYVHVINAKIETRYSVIISHSCDVSLKNENKRPYFIISPLFEINDYFRKRVDNDISRYNDLDPDKNKFINYFVFLADAAIENKDCFIDLCRCHSMDHKYLKNLEKVLQLSDDMREILKKKIFLSLLRPIRKE